MGILDVSLYRPHENFYSTHLETLHHNAGICSPVLAPSLSSPGSPQGVQCSPERDAQETVTSPTVAVFRSQRDKAQSFLRYVGSLVCSEQEVNPEDLQRSFLTIILGFTESHEPLNSHQKAMPWQAAAAQECVEAPVVAGMALKCVEMPLRKAKLSEE